jgi:hypothetical protein
MVWNLLTGVKCFLTDTPIKEVHAEFKNNNIKILEQGQIVDRTGAVGKLRSIYYVCS